MAATERLREIQQLIRLRRSVFPAEYKGGEVERSFVELMLENANWAPTHKFTEPWRFKVFSGQGLLRLTEAMERIYRSTTPPEKQRPEKIAKFRRLPEQVSHIIAICMHRSERETVPEVEEIAAVACAVQNMHLTVAAHEGVDGYWSSGAGTYSDGMKDFLSLGPMDRCLGFFYLGRSDAPRRTGKRRPIAEKVEWIES